MLDHFADNALPVLRRVADILDIRPDNLRKTRPQGGDNILGVIDAQRRLGHKGELA